MTLQWTDLPEDLRRALLEVVDASYDMADAEECLLRVRRETDEDEVVAAAEDSLAASRDGLQQAKDRLKKPEWQPSLERWHAVIVPDPWRDAK